MDDAARTSELLQPKRFRVASGFQVARLMLCDLDGEDGPVTTYRITWELEGGGIEASRDFPISDPDDEDVVAQAWADAVTAYDLADRTVRNGPWRVPA
jgi:hypothetical protein